jgi:hypothetical protein
MTRIVGMENKRSPFSLNIVELAFALGAGITTWFGLRYFLWITPPWPYDWSMYDSEPLPAWFTQGRQELFNLFVIPMVFIMAISAMFLLRGILNKEIKFFTRLSNIAIAWPIFSFITIHIISFLCFYPAPIGLILAFVELGVSYESEYKWGAMAAVVWNFAWLLIGGYYFGQWEQLYGD